MGILKAVEEIKEEITNKMVIKRTEYLSYIDEHINNVKHAYEIFCKIDWDDTLVTHDDFVLLKDRVSIHDESKYGDEEFEAYRKNFFPINDEEKKDNEEEFEEAWKHHYTVNDHHPEHWIVGDVPQEMPTVAVIEMMLDWQAMSFKFGGTCLSYYNSIKGTDKDKKLHPNTRVLLEELLEIYGNKLTEGL